ncbi:MAG: protein kinase [Myxococcales bacterium]|nr:protein kinase [Myxococcales bacterium]
MMELLEGADLRSFFRAGSLNRKQIVSVVIQVAKALGKAHESGVIHRDIKPGNIFLCTGDGDHFVKILDFGIAKLNFPATTAGTIPDRHDDRLTALHEPRAAARRQRRSTTAQISGRSRWCCSGSPRSDPLRATAWRSSRWPSTPHLRRERPPSTRRCLPRSTSGSRRRSRSSPRTASSRRASSPRPSKRRCPACPRAPRWGRSRRSMECAPSRAPPLGDAGPRCSPAAWCWPRSAPSAW